MLQFLRPKKYAILAALLVVTVSICAQESKKFRRFETAGAMIGFGSACRNYQDYRVFFIAGDFSRSINKPRKNDFVSLYLEPQFNTVKTDDGMNVEFGANIGIRNYIKINSGFYIYQMLGSGPHFISAHLKRQATGFIFSDNLFIGTLAKLNNDRFLNLQFGIRHISNAGIKVPNHGMNTYNLRIGVSRVK